jgi:hypothetical protein
VSTDPLCLNIIGSLIGTAIGALVTWCVSRYYYKKSGDELRAESDKLRKATHLVLYCQLHPGTKLTPEYDEQGYMRALRADMSAKLEGKGSLSADISDGKHP